ncbi:UDP-glycosyltransferase 86A1 [Sesamum angolense]|uniref:UDP-glycosyltransferase 86A1 n=1 Tax=Sesamum angolense TaxID=2727404 RepID=A0AAE1X7N6_9LAMI|nr:UDP-glycosyltransferase 86A1 [Sesamum angolense]
MAHPKPHAIVIPYPYQGHVTPMINLSIRLASSGFTITFVQTEFIHHFISKAQNLVAADVDLFDDARKSGLDMRYQTISDGFPVEFDRDLNFNEYWESMFRDFLDRVDEIVVRTMKADESSETLPFLLIADTFYTWPATIAKKHNMVNVSLWTEPAIVFSLDYHLELLRQNGHVPYNGYADSHINYIPGIQSISIGDLMTYLQDPEAIPMITQIANKGFEQRRAFGLNLTAPSGSNKPSGSVLYISFGSIAQSNKEEIGELAHGLLLSEVYFVWVLRPDIIGGNGTDILPEGFEDVIKDKGLIVPWCNQIDQPTNRKLVVDDWKIGVDLCDGEHVEREEVASKISIIMRGETSIQMKQDMEEVSKKLHDSLDAGGSSNRNFDRFVEDLKAKLCMRNP